MKNLILLILGIFILCSCSKFGSENELNSNSEDLNFKVSKLIIQDTVILNYIKKYLIDFHEDLDEKAITVIKYADSNKGSDYYISQLMPYESILKRYPPLGFLILDEQYILVYSGIERKLLINEASMDSLLEKLENYVIKDQSNEELFVPMNYDAPILKVRIMYDTVYSEVVGQNPY